MRRLLYIIFCTMAAVGLIVAQTPDPLPANPVGIESDSVVVNDSVPADSTILSALASSHTTMRTGRRINAVNNEATRTQHHNDAQGDTARMLERRRQRSIHYHDENGNMVMVDTVTGQEWVDSTMLPPPPKMKYPLMYGVEVGVNIWDPLMRAFGQKYGGVDFSAALNLHNRYLPTFEAGFGMANKTPETLNYTYKTPLAPYFKFGADYNFFYNSDPAYRLTAGLRYGFSAFSYRLEDVSLVNNYWGETGSIAFPSENVTAGWIEFVAGVKVKLFGPISAGWMFRYHAVLHQTHPPTGDAWYIPGYGTTNMAFTGSFSIYYNFDFKHPADAMRGPATDVGQDADYMVKNPTNSDANEQ